MNNRDGKNDGNTNDSASKSIDAVKEGLDLGSGAVKAAGAILPKPLAILNEVVNVASEVIKHPSGNTAEKLVCGAGKAIAQGVASAPLYGAAGAAGAARMPTPVTAGIGAAIGMKAAEPMINQVTEPVGKLADKACRSAFEWMRGPTQQSKVEQRQQASSIITRQRAWDSSMNSFAPKMNLHSYFSTPFSYRSYSFNTNPYFQYYSSSNSPSPSYDYGRVQMAVQNAIRSEMNNLHPSLNSAYLKACSELGYGYVLSMGEFRSAISSTSLISSYNAFNPYSSIRDVVNFCREIGGVGSFVSIIDDLINSEAHSEAQDFIICFREEDSKENQINPDLIKQIANELKQGYFVHQTSPFFSLHINNRGFQYPVLHPAYQQGLIGEIIGFLDYWMKGYLNGGVFSAEFLKMWHKTENINEADLRKNLIDLKKYCNDNKLTDLNYVSLRQWLVQHGIKDAFNPTYLQPYMTSFRIIAYQEKIERDGNLLIPYPTFKVEYTIDMMPDYENEVMAYYKEHGCYPPDYQQIRECYEIFCKKIQENLPQLPFCKTYFKLLYVINSLSYVYASLKKMGKMPNLSATPSVSQVPFPKSLPPIPVRYYRRLPMPITFSDVSKYLWKTAADINQFDTGIMQLFKQNSMVEGDLTFTSALPAFISNILKEKLVALVPQGTPIEINDDEVKRITRVSENFLLQNTYQYYAFLHVTLDKWLDDRLHDSSKASKKLIISEKITYLTTKLTTRLNELTTRWEGTKSLAKKEIFSALPKDLHPTVTKIFNDIEKLLLDQLNKEEEQTIKENSEMCERDINQQCNEAIQNLNLQLTELQTLRANQLAEIKKSNDFIASAPPHLRNLPANIKIIQDVQADIANMNQNLALIEQSIASLSKKITEVPTRRNELIALKKKEIIDAIQVFTNPTRKAIKEGTDDTIQTYYKNEAIRILKLSVENDCEKLQTFKHQIEHFSLFLNSIPEVMNMVISKEYIHTIIGFNHDEIAQQTGDRFRIIGGCGMELPSMTSQPLLDAKSLRTALNQAFKNHPKESIVQVTFNHQRYFAYRIPVTELKLELDQSIELKHFTKPENIQMALDKSGATAAHYAALLLPENEFDAVLKANSLPSFSIKDKLGHLPLHGAAKIGNAAVVSKLIQSSPGQLDACNHQGATPLLIAVQYGQLAVVKTLLSFKPNVNHLLSNGLFPLYIAIQNNFSEIATLLLDYPAISVNEKLDNFMTPLHLAIERELPQIALKLIEKGALFNIKRKADGFTAWHLAAQKGQLDVLKAMIAKGVDRHLALESNKTALHLASEAGKMETCQYLLSQGLLPDIVTREKETPLMLAIQSGQINIAEMLATTTSINLVNQSQQTASVVALRYHMPLVADILINRGENPQLRDKFGYDYKYYLIRNGEYHRLFSLVDKNKIYLHDKYEDETLLSIAAKYGHFMIVYELIDKNVKWKSKSSLALIDYAVMASEINYIRDHFVIKPQNTERATYFGSVNCVKLLLEKLCTSNTLIKETVLIAAIESAQTEIVDLVLEHWPDVNYPLDSDKQTALHVAIKTGSHQMVEFLLKRGSNLTLRNRANETVFHLAIKYEDKRILKRLFKLSTPKEWPHDIWHDTNTLSTDIKKILNQYQKRRVVDVSPNKNTITTVSHETLTISLEDKEKLLLHLRREAFEAATQLLEKTPSLMKLWTTNHGGDYLQTLFASIHDYSKFTDELKKTFKIEGNLPEFLSFDKSKRILNYLKQAKVDPARFLGKQNVLLSIVLAEDEETACYRFNLLAEYFPQALPTLLSDHCLPDTRAAQIAITRNWRKLFMLLDRFARKFFDQKMLSSLHDAVAANHYESVAELLQQPPVNDHITELFSHWPVNVRNAKGQTPLMLAAANGNVRVMELLLRFNACPNLMDREGNTALYYAIQSKSDEAALLMISHLPNKNAANFLGLRPLFFAAANGMLNVVRVLCDEPSAHAVDSLGRNALHYAALKGHTHIIEYLVQNNFAIDQVEAPQNHKKMKHSQKRTPLHLAAWMGQIEAVCKLIALGANVNTEDARGYTVIEYGIKSKRVDMLQLIQQIPAYHDQNENRLTRLLHAAAESNHIEVLSELILNNVNLNTVNQIGETVLHITARFDSVDAAKLLAQGKDYAVDTTNLLGNTALHVAASEGHVSIVETLLKANAAIDKQNMTLQTPLFVAAQKGHKGVISTLLRYRADLTLTNDKGMTPLQVAESNNQYDVVRLLRK